MGVNDNEEDRSCPLGECHSGDVVTHLGGSRWEVVHVFDEPTIFLKKVGVEWNEGLDGPCLTVVRGAPFEGQFYCLGHYNPEEGEDFA